MAATSAPSSAELQSTSGVERDNDQTLDVQVLKDAATKALVNALNSASFSMSSHPAHAHRFILGKWCKDARTRFNSCRTPRSCYRSRALKGISSGAHIMLVLICWQNHGVDKMFWLEPGPLASTTTNVIYLCRPLIKYVKMIAGQ